MCELLDDSRLLQGPWLTHKEEEAYCQQIKARLILMASFVFLLKISFNHGRWNSRYPVATVGEVWGGMILP